MNLGNLIIPLGITTYVFVLITIISGLRRWKLKFHKVLAIATITFASLHALLVIISYF